ncbi:zinc-binding alcohol dehydrogenase family protein [candidate division KSB1 bacterium]
MKAIQITKHGGPKVLVPADVPVPELNEDQLLINVKAAGINFADILSRQGLYADAPRPPFTPGYEIAGVVEKVGTNVTGFSEGDRVTAITNFGGYAEYAVSHPAFTFKLDNSVSFIYGAAIPINWITAYHSIFFTGIVNKGDRVLIHAAAGGTGIAAVRLLKSRGCVVFGTAGSENKLKFLKNIGVDYPINYREEDFSKAVKNVVGERGIDLIIDSIGGDYIRKGLKLLRANGRIVVMGFASFAGKSKVAISFRSLKKFMVSPFHLMGYSNAVYGVYISRIIKDRPDLCTKAFSKVVEMLNAGKISPTIDSMYSLENAADAHRLIENRKTIGKVILNNE